MERHVAVALWDYCARRKAELSFPRGATLHVFAASDGILDQGNGWASAVLPGMGGRRGLIPLNYVELRQGKAADEVLKTPAEIREKVDASSAFDDEDEDGDGGWQDDEYFTAYADDFKIHEEMLQDKSRTLSYIRALEAAKAQIEGKVVMEWVPRCIGKPFLASVSS